MSMQPNNYYSALRLQDKLKCQCNLTNIIVLFDYKINLNVNAT